MKDYADQLIMENRNNVYHSSEYTRVMPCPNRWKLGEKEDWRDPERYENKKNREISECPSGENGTVEMRVREEGMWTIITCPICNYRDFWSIGDGDALF
jgi:hypothetical protein